MKKYYPLFLAPILFFSTALLVQAVPGGSAEPRCSVRTADMFPTYQVITTHFSNMKEGAGHKYCRTKKIKINAAHAPRHIFCSFGAGEHVEIVAQAVDFQSTDTTAPVIFDFDVQPDATCDPAFAASLSRLDGHTFAFTAPTTREFISFTCTITDAQGNKQVIPVSGRVCNFVHPHPFPTQTSVIRSK